MTPQYPDHALLSRSTVLHDLMRLCALLALIVGSACANHSAAPAPQLPHTRLTTYTLPNGLTVDIDAVNLFHAPDGLPKHYTFCSLLVTATTPPDWKLLTSGLAPSQTAWDLSFQAGQGVVSTQVDIWAKLSKEGIKLTARNDCFTPPTLVVECPVSSRKSNIRRIAIAITTLFFAAVAWGLTR